jgi:hypothetical protein
MKPDEPRKQLKAEELLTAMIGKTIRTVKSTEVDLLNIEFTDGTEVELKAENIDYGGDCAIIAYEPIYLNSRDIANMPLEKDFIKLIEGIVMNEKQSTPELYDFKHIFGANIN